MDCGAISFALLNSRMEPPTQQEGQLHNGNQSPGAVHVRNRRVDILSVREPM